MNDRRVRIGLRAMAAALLCLVTLTLTASRAEAVSPCGDHGDGNDAARHYVCNLYFLYLHEPSEGEVNYWIDALSTSSTAVVAADLIASQEALARFVGDEYGNLLERFGDPGGVRFWTDQLMGGMPDEDFEATLASSDEAFALVGGVNDNYVEYLYDVILDRSASNEEIASWADLITAGTLSRGAVASAFTHSDEFAAMVTNNLYGVDLGRAADPAGFAFWSAYLHSHGVRQGYIAFLSTAEAYANLSSGVF